MSCRHRGRSPPGAPQAVLGSGRFAAGKGAPLLPWGCPCRERGPGPAPPERRGAARRAEGSAHLMLRPGRSVRWAGTLATGVGAV